MIPYQTWDNTLQHLTVQTGSQTCNVAKNFTRLASVFASLAQEEPTVTADLAGVQGKLQNQFYLCDQKAANGDVESYITINNKRMPDFNTIGCQMHMKRLLSAMGTYSSVAHGSNINDVAYGCVKGTAAKSWIAAYDLETAAHHGATSSGESLATGGVLSVNLQELMYLEKYVPFARTALFDFFQNPRPDHLYNSLILHQKLGHFLSLKFSPIFA